MSFLLLSIWLGCVSVVWGDYLIAIDAGSSGTKFAIIAKGPTPCPDGQPNWCKPQKFVFKPKLVLMNPRQMTTLFTTLRGVMTTVNQLFTKPPRWEIAGKATAGNRIVSARTNDRIWDAAREAARGVGGATISNLETLHGAEEAWYEWLALNFNPLREEVNFAGYLEMDQERSLNVCRSFISSGGSSAQAGVCLAAGDMEDLRDYIVRIQAKWESCMIRNRDGRVIGNSWACNCEADIDSFVRIIKYIPSKSSIDDPILVYPSREITEMLDAGPSGERDLLAKLNHECGSDTSTTKPGKKKCILLVSFLSGSSLDTLELGVDDAYTINSCTDTTNHVNIFGGMKELALATYADFRTNPKFDRVLDTADFMRKANLRPNEEVDVVDPATFLQYVRTDDGKAPAIRALMKADFQELILSDEPFAYFVNFVRQVARGKNFFGVGAFDNLFGGAAELRLDVEAFSSLRSDADMFVFAKLMAHTWMEVMHVGRIYKAEAGGADWTTTIGILRAGPSFTVCQEIPYADCDARTHTFNYAVPNLLLVLETLLDQL